MVDLWCYFPELSHERKLVSAQAALMTPDEHERCGRFHLEHDRRLFIATRALARTVLSNYGSVAPSDWRFSPGKHGKPYIAYPILTPPIHFNLAHTPGLVVCVVSVANKSIGVDAEIIKGGRDMFSLAEVISPPPRGAHFGHVPHLSNRNSSSHTGRLKKVTPRLAEMA